MNDYTAITSEFAEMFLGSFSNLLTDDILADANTLAQAWYSHKDFGTVGCPVHLGKSPELSWIELLPEYKALLEKRPRLPENKVMSWYTFDLCVHLANGHLHQFKLKKLNSRKDHLIKLANKSQLTKAEESELYILQQMQLETNSIY